MGGKIIDENGDLVYEFPEGTHVSTLLSGFITRAKFSEKFDDLIILGNHWLHDLHKATIAADYNTKELLEKFQTSSNRPKTAPDYFLKNGLTQNDWDYSEFFNEFTIFLMKNVANHNWGNLNFEKRSSFIRIGLFPHEISDTRLVDMIEDVDHHLERNAKAFNPNYKDS